MTRQPDRSVSRRAALAGLGAGGLGLAFAAASPVVVYEGVGDLVGYFLVGICVFLAFSFSVFLFSAGREKKVASARDFSW